MNPMRRCVLFILFSLSGLLAQAQTHTPRQFILQFKSGVDLREFSKEWAQFKGQPTQFFPKKRLIPNMDIWLWEYKNAEIHELEFLATLRKHPAVENAQLNHTIRHRNNQPHVPNDPLYSNQWQYDNNGSHGGTVDADMDGPEAWAISTGGYTPLGDTIVVAILDDGVDINHSDLLANLWVNSKEIPNNHLDDDHNGYVDDYLGWNPISENDHVGSGSAGNHGTPMAGIIGAVGNNANQVTGVNWTVKLMIVKSDFNTDEATVLAAYGYALQQRKLYNASNGTAGAFVVATNASWGRDYGRASDAPIWCAFYDTLGQYGILNVCATANLNVNVDTQGDLPTTCPSDYLIGVTNVNRLGEKVFGAAYGRKHVDLGAAGQTVYTLKNGNSNGISGGTSSAAPHVTGAIALAYAAGCENFATLAKVHPERAALEIKNFILHGVTTESTLAHTVAGGYLNLHQTLVHMQNSCPTNCFPPYHVENRNTTDTYSEIHWYKPTSSDSILFAYRKVGTSWGSNQILSADSIALGNLESCTAYETRLISFCNGNLGDTSTRVFLTDGCCNIPSGLAVEQALGQSDPSLIWQDQLAALSYELRYRKAGTSAWIDTLDNINEAQLRLTALDSCTYYEFQVRMHCSHGRRTDFSTEKIFVTKGCRSCSLIDYCTASGQNARDDYIQKFTLGDFEHNSGNNNGYLLYDDEYIGLDLGSTYPISVKQGGSYLEQVRVWLDYNQDGDFEDAQELIFEERIPYISTASGTVTLPDTGMQGVTRLRVAMQWANPPLLCTNPVHGEVEDYCVQILPALSSTPKQNTASWNAQLFPNPFSKTLSIQVNLSDTEDVYYSLWNPLGQLIERGVFEQLPSGEQQLHMQPKTELASGIYYIQLSTRKETQTLRIQKCE